MLLRSLLPALTLLLAASGPTPAQAAPDAKAVDQARIRVASLWLEWHGVLVGDGRTALIPAPGLDAGRPLAVRSELGGDPVGATARRFPGTVAGLYVLALDREVGGAPLQVAERIPSAGETVYVALWPPDGGVDLGETMVTLASDTTIAIAAPAWTIPVGAPVLDAEGRLIALMADGQTATRVAPALRPNATEARGMGLMPISGYRFGAEIGGPFGVGFTFDGDAGLTFDDTWSVLLRLGLTAATAEHREALPATSELGPGYSQRNRFAFRFGLEGRYRILLSDGSFPVYLDLAAGVRLTTALSEPDGPAQRSTDPSCDPLRAQCPLQEASGVPGLHSTESFGTSVGLDLRLGFVTLGYRFLPAALGWQQEDTHHLTFGFGIF